MVADNCKEWASHRRGRKFSQRRDCRKACAQGHTLRKTDPRLWKFDGFYEPYVSESRHWHYPNRVERMFGKVNPNVSDIESNIAEIITETQPNEIIHVPSGKRIGERQRRNGTGIYLIYKQSIEEKENAVRWKLKKLREMNKKCSEIEKPILLRNTYDATAQKHRNIYKPPLVTEPPIRIKKICVSYLENTTKLVEHIDFDLGSNKWITAFGTQYIWGWSNTTREKLELLSGIDRFVVFVACDETERTRNFDKFHTKNGCKKQNSAVTRISNKPNSNRTQIKVSLSKRSFNRESAKQSKRMKENKDTRVWQYMGQYSGYLHGYYVNFNRPFSVTKKYRFGSNQSNPNYSALQIGHLVRWIRVKPKNPHDSKFCLSVYGCEVDLLSKPILNPQQRLCLPDPIEPMDLSSENVSHTTNGTECDSKVTEPSEYDWSKAPIHIGSSMRLAHTSKFSRIRKMEMEANDFVVVGIHKKPSHLFYSRHFESPKHKGYFERSGRSRSYKKNELIEYFKYFELLR